MIKNSFLLFLFLFALPVSCLAQTFDSASYHIDWGNFNMTGGKKNSASYQITDTVGQNAPGQFGSNGYIVKSGFQYIYDSLSKFTFSIDKLNIDFGSLVPNVGSTNANTITISSPSRSGYQISVQENHPLTVNPSIQIPNTKCDAANCTLNFASPWINNNTYGFGYNAIGVNQSGVATNIGTSNYFTNSTYYRPFANTSAIPSEVGAIIMSENSPVQKHSARITFKINISASQAAGNYQNSITFIAVPKY